MIYIILCVSISVSLLVVFKIFERLKINTFYAIVLNYLFAAITGILFLKFQTGNTLLYQSSSWPITLPLGILFISVFYAISQTAQKISISVASVANKMSVILPVLFSLLVLKETITAIKISGILIALTAVVFSMYKHSEKQSYNQFMLPALVFFGSGLIDIGMNYANNSLIKSSSDTYLFSTSIFITAFVCGIIFVTGRFILIKSKGVEPNKLSLKDVAGGLLLGIPNYFSIYFMLKALGSGVLSPALLFPVLNVSNVLLTAFIGILFYKENLSKLNYIGLFLAVISLILIAA
jgi:drug/metabolite transporter (DMT)-like permease